MAARKLTPAQARERKAKITAGCLAVVFLGVAAIQGPTLLKSLHKPSAAPAVAAPGPTEVPGQATTQPPTAAAQSAGQLTNFSRFRLQDPFRAQVAVGALDGATSTTTTTPASKPAPKPAPKEQPAPKPKPAPAPVPVVVTTPTVPFTTKPAGPPNAALITLNGKQEIVLVGAGFPAIGPLFKLVSLGKKDVKIGVLGGSFTSGAPTLALLRGRPITLADEADGSRYVLRLVRLTVTTPPAQTTTTTTPSAG